MARPRSNHPTDTELEILQVLWRTGPASLGTIHEQLRRRREVAKTTVAAMLKLMLDKRLVRRTEGPRGYRWSAAVTQRQTAADMVGKLVAGVFDGSARRMVAHLVEAGDITEEDLDEMRRVVRDQKHPGGRTKKKQGR